MFYSEEQIRKKAGVLFGIRFEGDRYKELEAHLKTIKSNKDLVSVTFKTVIFETFSIIRVCSGKKIKYEKKYSFRRNISVSCNYF